MKFFGSMKLTKENTLEIGECTLLQLSKEFGTPLYIMDELLLRDTCKIFKESFSHEHIKTEIIYASKAFLNLWMCKIINEEGLSLDVVSGGELFTALKANFPTEKIYMHGNNKSEEELTLALETGVGRIIVDNLDEIKLIEKLCNNLNKKADILIRVNPGIEAHTHEYIQTSKNDSKFGLSIFDENLYSVVKSLTHNKYLNLKGFHCHIGSQIFEYNSFYSEVSVMMDFTKKLETYCGFQVEELNLGGGFGVYYNEEDTPLNLQLCLNNMLNLVEQICREKDLKLPKVMIEPGRSIVANCGSTLYKVGSIKETYSGKKHIFVDGGMTDNPRTALYDAKYEATIVNRVEGHTLYDYTISGKCCESGDIIIKNIKLPMAEKEDLLLVSSTGAYNYSMSSNYNRNLKPAVVAVFKGEAKLIVRRETYEDLVRNDVFY